MPKQKNKGSKGKKPIDFLTEANIERLTHNPNIQKMFGMKDKEEKQENDDSQKDNKTEPLQESHLRLDNIVKQLPYIIIAAGFCIIVFAVIYIVNSIPFGLYWYLSLILFFGCITIFIILSKNKKKYISNQE